MRRKILVAALLSAMVLAAGTGRSDIDKCVCTAGCECKAAGKGHVPGEAELKAAKKQIPSLERAVERRREKYPWLSVPLLLSMGSRETWWGTVPGYKPKGFRLGRGDSGRGFGFLQIDIRYHTKFILSGKWMINRLYLDKAVEILAHDGYGTLDQFEDENQRIRAAVASYNAGGCVKKSDDLCGDVDGVTTGANYSRDVFELMCGRNDPEGNPEWEGYYRWYRENSDTERDAEVEALCKWAAENIDGASIPEG